MIDFVYKRLFVIDPGLYKISSHHYNHARLIYSAAKSICLYVEVWGNKCITFKNTEFKIFSKLAAKYYFKKIRGVLPIFMIIKLIVNNFYMMFDLKRLQTIRDIKHSLIYFPNVNHSIFLGIILWCFLIRFRHGQFKIVCRWLNTYENTPLHYQFFTKMIFIVYRLFNRIHKGFLVLATETEYAKEYFVKFMKTDVVILPTPFDMFNFNGNIRRSRRINKKIKKNICITYLGPARSEKGFNYLPDVVMSFYKNNQYYGGNAKFLIQCVLDEFDSNMKMVKQSIRKLKVLSNNGFSVSLIDKSLTISDYYSFLNESDIILLPYDPHKYKYRGSGIFIEALAYGKFVIVSDGTCMANEIVKQVNGLTFEFNNPKNLVDVIYKAMDCYKSYIMERENIAFQIREKHSNINFLRLLLNV